MPKLPFLSAHSVSVLLRVVKPMYVHAVSILGVYEHHRYWSMYAQSMGTDPVSKERRSPFLALEPRAQLLTTVDDLGLVGGARVVLAAAAFLVAAVVGAVAGVVYPE